MQVVYIAHTMPVSMHMLLILSIQYSLHETNVHTNIFDSGNRSKMLLGRREFCSAFASIAAT